MKRKKGNRIRKKEFKRITKKHEQKLLLRQQAVKELDILINLLSKEIECEEKMLKEANFHLEAKQKELTYFGYRGIIVGVVVAVLTSIFTSTGFPIVLDAIEKVDQLNSVFEKIIHFLIAVLLILTLVIMCAFVFRQSLTPFFGDDKEIRDQIYINEYMIKIVRSKIDKMK